MERLTEQELEEAEDDGVLDELLRMPRRLVDPNAVILKRSGNRWTSHKMTLEELDRWAR